MILDNKKTILAVLLVHAGLLYGVVTNPPAVIHPAEPLMMVAVPLPMGEPAPELMPAKQPPAKSKPKVQPVVKERRQASVKPAVVQPAPRQEATEDRAATMEIAAVEKTELAPQTQVAQSVSNNEVAANAPTGGGSQGQSPERHEAPTEASFHANYLNNPKPTYPAQSRALGEQGVVLLRVIVSASGLAESVELHKTSGFARLDTVAKNTVRRWRFVPAKRGEQAISGTVIVPINFSLKNS